MLVIHSERRQMSQQTKGFVIAMVGIVIWLTTPIFIGYLIILSAVIMVQFVKE
jgi:low affinity Fe/Cu permease